MIDCYCLNCLKAMKKETGIKDMLYIDDVLCCSCRKELLVYMKQIKIGKLKVFSLYPYQGLFRDLLIQYKELYDEALFSLFLYPFVKKFKKKYKDYYLVQIPSSQHAIGQRGFEHVKQIFSITDMKMLDLFEKTSDSKQKLLPLDMRQNILESFIFKDNFDISNKKILLVDDVITSGNSMLACYNLIKNKCQEVQGFTLGYNTKYLKIYDKIFTKYLLSKTSKS